MKLADRLNENLLENIKAYIKKEQLECKWRKTLEELKIFDDELKEIKEELDNMFKTQRLKDLDKIQQRSIDLKH